MSTVLAFPAGALLAAGSTAPQGGKQCSLLQRLGDSNLSFQEYVLFSDKHVEQAAWWNRTSSQRKPAQLSVDFILIVRALTWAKSNFTETQGEYFSEVR